jgi:hypothetical protein
MPPKMEPLPGLGLKARPLPTLLEGSSKRAEDPFAISSAALSSSIPSFARAPLPLFTSTGADAGANDTLDDEIAEIFGEENMTVSFSSPDKLNESPVVGVAAAKRGSERPDRDSPGSTMFPRIEPLSPTGVDIGRNILSQSLDTAEAERLLFSPGKESPPLMKYDTKGEDHLAASSAALTRSLSPLSRPPYSRTEDNRSRGVGGVLRPVSESLENLSEIIQGNPVLETSFASSPATGGNPELAASRHIASMSGMRQPLQQLGSPEKKHAVTDWLRNSKEGLVEPIEGRGGSRGEKRDEGPVVHFARTVEQSGNTQGALRQHSGNIREDKHVSHKKLLPQYEKVRAFFICIARLHVLYYIMFHG